MRDRHDNGPALHRLRIVRLVDGMGAVSRMMAVVRNHTVQRSVT